MMDAAHRAAKLTAIVDEKAGSMAVSIISSLYGAGFDERMIAILISALAHKLLLSASAVKGGGG